MGDVFDQPPFVEPHENGIAERPAFDAMRSPARSPTPAMLRSPAFSIALAQDNGHGE